MSTWEIVVDSDIIFCCEEGRGAAAEPIIVIIIRLGCTGLDGNSSSSSVVCEGTTGEVASRRRYGILRYPNYLIF